MRRWRKLASLAWRDARPARRRLLLFHHDPSHSDAVLDELTEVARARGTSIEVVAGREGAQYDLGSVHA